MRSSVVCACQMEVTLEVKDETIQRKVFLTQRQVETERKMQLPRRPIKQTRLPLDALTREMSCIVPETGASLCLAFSLWRSVGAVRRCNGDSVTGPV